LNVLREWMRAANGTKFSPRPSYCKASVDRATNSALELAAANATRADEVIE
jgi:hypothetical protein